MEKYIGKYSVKDFLYLILGAFIYSIGTHSFIETANIAPGGAVGVALMLNHVTNLPVGRLTLMVNVPLLILAWFHLSRAFALRTAFACGICSVVLDYVIAPVFPVYMGDQLMGSLYGGILVGVGMAFIFLSGSTTGGSDVVGYLLQKKYPHVSIGRALMMIDGIILSTSIFVFGNVDAALFGLISLYAQTKVIDMIIYGIRNHDTFIRKVYRRLCLLPLQHDGALGYSGRRGVHWQRRVFRLQQPQVCPFTGITYRDWSQCVLWL